MTVTIPTQSGSSNRKMEGIQIGLLFFLVGGVALVVNGEPYNNQVGRVENQAWKSDCFVKVCIPEKLTLVNLP